MFEQTAVFERGVGEVTDIVEKELFRIVPRTEESESWALRPEPTAGIVRAYVQHGMQTWPQPVKVYEIGPMFRYDRPQAGRYRQFWQFDVEAIGDPGPAVDAEIVELGMRFYRDAGLDGVQVLLNSIGDPACRPAYIEELTAYYRAHADALPPTERGRLDRNVASPARLEGSGDGGDQRRRAAHHRPAVRRVRGAFRRGPCASRRARRRVPPRARARPRARLLHPDGVRVLCRGPRGPAAGARRRRAATTASSSCSAAGRRRVSGSASGSIGCSSRSTSRRRETAGRRRPTPRRPSWSAPTPTATVDRLRIATLLRGEGIAARAELGQRKLGKQLEAAARDQAHFAIIVGDELANGEVQLKDLPAGTQKVVERRRPCARGGPRPPGPSPWRLSGARPEGVSTGGSRGTVSLPRLRSSWPNQRTRPPVRACTTPRESVTPWPIRSGSPPLPGAC